MCGNIYCMYAIVVRKVPTFLMSLDEFGDEKKNSKMAQDTAGKYSLTVGLLFFKNLIHIELHILVGVPVSPKDLGT